jgi:hypothetical protein
VWDEEQRRRREEMEQRDAQIRARVRANNEIND